MSEKRIEEAARFSLLWARSRSDAGRSQEYMALALGVSKKTIQNWERGTSSPSLFQGFEWFNVLGLNPLRYYLNYLYPEMFEGLRPGDSDDDIKAALQAYLDTATPQEHRQLLYIIAGNHGGDWYALLQLITAHCHTSMQSRVAAARVILENYEVEAATDRLVCPANIQPDIELLEKAVHAGKGAAKNGVSGYAVK